MKKLIKWYTRRQIRKGLKRLNHEQKLSAERVFYASHKVIEALEELDKDAMANMIEEAKKFKTLAYNLHIRVKENKNLIPTPELKELADEILWNYFFQKSSKEALRKEDQLFRQLNTRLSGRSWRDLDYLTKD